MSDPITSLPAAVAAQGALPMPVGTAPTVCGRCNQPVVRFAADDGGGWMHEHGNTDADDNPATWANHPPVIEVAAR